MALVLARGLSDGLIGLIKQADAAVKAHADRKANGFVAFLHSADDEAFRKSLEDLAKKEGLTIPLTVCDDGTKGPGWMTIPADAYAALVVYEKKKVEENVAWREGDLGADATKAAEKALAVLGGK
jgi:hypothetical protein